ncbi:MmgE/PrpD family protein [Ramlibacter sp. WS9]|uniref:MmgE/PrpD family protein n=1 Tax=Ramlibacter sp. WS9 TaxID=1882741 RepID=UPI0011416F3C|nr:MmgE/PrpD family protein [Ramlibacter sp. WS9]ROZ78027.1 MmgE/PrpD family protein [Ramlibacter sp. WS9]
MEKVDAAVKLAHRAVETRYEDLTQQEVLATKHGILDTFGVLLAGTTLGPKVREIVEFVKESGGREEATILGFGGKVPAMMAAYANGATVHSLDFDDTHDPSTLHPTASCLPAALAVMEKLGGKTGRDLITAIAVGNDLVSRMGSAAPTGISEAGLLAPMTFGYFGSAVAAGKILGLSKDQMVGCMGLAYTQVSGSGQHFVEGGSDVRLIYQSFNNKAGVLSALLTEKGVNGGGRNALEGEYGFYDLFFRGKYDPKYVDVKMGDRYEGTSISIKPYPSCRQTHPYIDATRALIAKHDITPQRVAKVELKVGTLGKHLCLPEQSRKRPTLTSDAKFSVPYPVAACLVYGNIDLASFLTENLANPQVLAMVGKVEWVFDERISRSVGVEPAIVTIHTTDGKSYTERVDHGLGAPENPMSQEQLVAKFRDCAGYSINKMSKQSIDRVVELCLDLDNVSDIGELVDFLT